MLSHPKTDPRKSTKTKRTLKNSQSTEVPELVAKFDEIAAEQSAKLMGTLTIFTATMYILWAIGDFEYFPDHAWKFFGYRVIGLLVSTGSVLVALRAASPQTIYTALIFWFVGWCIPQVVMLQDMPDFVLSQMMILFIGQLVSPAFVLWNWKWAVVMSSTLFIVWEIGMLMIDIPPENDYDLFSTHAYLLTGVAFAGFGSKIRHRTAFAQFKAERRLEEIMQSRTKFYHNIAHELRTPLTLIIAPAKALINRLAKPEKELDVIHNNAKRLLQFADDMLDLAKIDEKGLQLNVQKVDLGEIVQKHVANTVPGAEARGLQISFEIDKEQKPLNGDAHRLESILGNLVGNALKYTPNGGQIVVRVKDKGDRIRLEVEDNGDGIPSEKLSLIFERFEQVGNTSVGGVGIGLNLTKELVELHGGRIGVLSTEGEGTTFWVELPYDHLEIDDRPITIPPQGGAHSLRAIVRDIPAADPLFEGHTAGPVTRSQAPSEVRGTVLVADDEPAMLDYIVSFLSREFLVITARDGVEAFEQCLEHRPDIVISDFMMPRKDGLSLCADIKAHDQLRRTPIIIVTARGDIAAEGKALSAGADDFLAKPFEEDVLRARVLNQLSRAKMLVEFADREKMASVGVYAAGYLHDVNNPITAVIGGVAALKTGPLTATQQKGLDLIISGADRIKKTSAALKHHVRPAEQDSAKFFMVHEGVEASASLLANKFQDVVVHIAGDPQTEAFGEPVAINQISMNLIENAALSGATLVNITIAKDEDPGFVTVVVQDNGPGVPAEHVNKIFDLYYTTRAVGEGSGFGLHVSRNAARRNSGDLKLVPSETGARFVLTVPTEPEKEPGLLS